VLTRMSAHPPTLTYVERRTKACVPQLIGCSGVRWDQTRRSEAWN